ncbi:MAG TPA: ABC transporter substrate-binding protein [Streptosporangiaceae bacterium]|nr:ABC transporter substrate-binding protein [Streptosporangiaceae bacterium]
MPRRSAIAVTLLTAISLLAAGCGRSLSQAESTQGEISPTAGLVTTTPAGTKPVQSVTWAVYRDVNSLDPAFAFDYPENTAISLMCESLLLQQPDGAIAPGLASVTSPTPLKFVFTLKPGARFWDGDPVTPADVVYSLDRQMSTQLGGFYTDVFNRVKSVAATGSNQVTITMSQPDYWLEGELASMGGVIIQKSFAEQQGKNYGTPAGSIMCTGPYMLKSWTPSGGVVAVVNPRYWNTATHPLVKQIVIKGVPDITDFTAGMLTGAIGGSYYFGVSTLDQLEASKQVKVYQGPGWSTDALIISATSGPLANVKVRQALSLALNRESIISTVYRGAALMPKWLANPGTFGFGTSVFDKDYAAAPTENQNLAEAKKLVQEAGDVGQTITIGTSNEISSTAIETGAYQAAAEAIGLKVVLHSVSAQDFINFFTDPSFRKGIDAFTTINYGDFADPDSLLYTLAYPGGDQNYDNYSNPEMTRLLNEAESTANPDQRAALTAQAEELAAQQLPWIPTVQPTNILFLNSSLTGATASFAYMFAPWADYLGGK